MDKSKLERTNVYLCQACTRNLCAPWRDVPIAVQAYAQKQRANTQNERHRLGEPRTDQPQRTHDKDPAHTPTDVHLSHPSTNANVVHPPPDARAAAGGAASRILHGSSSAADTLKGSATATTDAHFSGTAYGTDALSSGTSAGTDALLSGAAVGTDVLVSGTSAATNALFGATSAAADALTGKAPAAGDARAATGDAANANAEQALAQQIQREVSRRMAELHQLTGGIAPNVEESKRMMNQLADQKKKGIFNCVQQCIPEFDDATVHTFSNGCCICCVSSHHTPMEIKCVCSVM